MMQKRFSFAGITSVMPGDISKDESFVAVDLDTQQCAYDVFNWPGKPAGSRGLMFAIADRMDDMTSSEAISRRAVELLSRLAFVREIHSFDKDYLKACFEQIDFNVWPSEFGPDISPSRKPTLTCILFSGSRAIIGHMGNSCAYLIRRGSLVRLTPTDLHIAEDGIGFHPDSRLSARAPYVEEIKITSGDIFMLCTERLAAIMSHEDIHQILSLPLTAYEKCERLIRSAGQRADRSALTVIVGHVGVPFLPTSVYDLQITKLFPRELF